MSVKKVKKIKKLKKKKEPIDWSLFKDDSEEQARKQHKLCKENWSKLDQIINDAAGDEIDNMINGFKIIVDMLKYDLPQMVNFFKSYRKLIYQVNPGILPKLDRVLFDFYCMINKFKATNI